VHLEVGPVEEQIVEAVTREVARLELGELT